MQFCLSCTCTQIDEEHIAFVLCSAGSALGAPRSIDSIALRRVALLPISHLAYSTTSQPRVHVARDGLQEFASMSTLVDETATRGERWRGKGGSSIPSRKVSKNPRAGLGQGLPLPGLVFQGWCVQGDMDSVGSRRFTIQPGTHFLRCGETRVLPNPV